MIFEEEAVTKKKGSRFGLLRFGRKKLNNNNSKGLDQRQLPQQLQHDNATSEEEATLRTVNSYQDLLSLNAPVKSNVPKRSVRFEVDANDEIIKHYDPRPHPLTEDDIFDDKRDLWCTSKDIRGAVVFSAQLAAFHKDNRRDYIKAFNALFKTCCKSTVLDMDVHFLSKSTTRGLEARIFDKLEERRSKYVKQVLVQQKKLSSTSSADDMSEILAIKAQEHSRPWRMLARAMGVADEMEAKKLVNKSI